MRITCPECFAQFDVPDGAIKETGRKLRCGQCKHQWHQLPIPGEPTEIMKTPTEELEPKISETYNEFETPPIPEKSDIKASANIKTKSLPIGKIILVTLIIASIFGFIYGRSVIVAHAPASSILYDKLGLHVPVPGEFLVIKNVGVWRENRGGMEVLAVKGELFNPNETIQEVPIIKGSEVDATGRVLATESFVPEAVTLLPNETIKFEYQTPFPDEKTVSVIVTFSDEKRSNQYGY
ncbi:zinc-ribbon domain-containing protein [Alphaproteobacteria bacterium]|nr:zinc-ribbon domain-containing protein [Alphaproteobacteria bacterium]